MELLIASDENQDGDQRRISSSYNRTGHVCCDDKYFHQLSTYIYLKLVKYIQQQREGPMLIRRKIQGITLQNLYDTIHW